jgi:hypothetical protein
MESWFNPRNWIRVAVTLGAQYHRVLWTGDQDPRRPSPQPQIHHLHLATRPVSSSARPLAAVEAFFRAAIPNQAV